ncbi:PadR family transcriptional regulator [Paenibacillus sp. CAA11]|uniref:PadR family transcriptional regulator n=1 Tax=Paenibacillus sp. CAA11 TaxID=1532905 RepID=UPI00131F3425|nr:PadR family transcriptional regulator [Paenibacillus sp. CAA11]
MNSLAYALLAMLVRKPCSGYELAKMMEVFWQAKHSQIYPLLAKLEGGGFLTAENIEQTGKPNKKIYTITESGRAQLKSWIGKAPAHPVSRDEFLIKAYSLSLSDRGTAVRLFEDRIELYEKKLQARNLKLNSMIEEFGEQIENPIHPAFGRYIVHRRRLHLEEQEIAWCRWVLELLEA